MTIMPGFNWQDMMRQTYNLNNARQSIQDYARNPETDAREMLMRTVQQAMQPSQSQQQGPSGFQTALQYAKPAMGALKLADSLTGNIASSYASNLIGELAPSISSALPIAGAAIGPALTLAYGLATKQGGDKLMYSVPMSAMMAGMGPLSLPLVALQTGMMANTILEQETAQERYHNMQERQGQGRAGIQEATERLSKARSPQELMATLRQPYGEAGTLGGVMRTMLEGNLSGKYLTPDPNMGGGEMYWEPQENLRDLYALLQHAGIEATPYAGNQGSSRISNINELIAHSGGGYAEEGKYGPKFRPSEAGGIGNWNALLSKLSSQVPKAESLEPWGWNDEQINQQVFGFGAPGSDPNTQMLFHDQARNNPYFLHNMSGTPAKAQRAASLIQQQPVDENEYREWRVRSGYRDPEDFAWINRDNPDYQHAYGGGGGGY